jgi:hypothetical protein
MTRRKDPTATAPARTGEAEAQAEAEAEAQAQAQAQERKQQEVADSAAHPEDTPAQATPLRDEPSDLPATRRPALETAG